MAETTKKTGLMNRTLIHTAATLHYMDGLSQIQVAHRMQMSTASVSRLLAKARAEGIVRFEVLPLDVAASDDFGLCEALGLRKVCAIENVQQAALSVAVSQLLRDAELPKSPVITVGWGRAVQRIVGHGLPNLPDAIVVPTTGGMNETQSHFQINEFARTAAEQMGGTSQLLYAPARPGRDLFAQLSQDAQIAAIMALWNRVDAAITGIGNFPDTSSERSLGFTPGETARIKGDIVRQYFDINGVAIDWPGQDSQIGISRAQLQRVPLTIGVCWGEDKVDAVIGAARSGMINTLVTDIWTAQKVRKKLGLRES